MTHAERFTPEGGSPIELEFVLASHAAPRLPRLIGATRAALSMLSGWFGPLPWPPDLMIIGADRTRPGVRVVIDGRRPALQSTTWVSWLAPARDQRIEREVIRELVREYWRDSFDAPDGSFRSSLIAYLSMRAIHQQLEGSNFATPRFFGGFVPFPLRSVLLSPPVADPRPRVTRFDDPGEALGDPELARGVRALQTIERFVGWPTMLETLAAIRAGTAANVTPQGFADALSDIRGTDMRFLVQECFRADAVFDYAIADVQSTTTASGHVETTVMIARQGPGVFATSAGADRTPAMTMRVRFADGTELRDVFDGAAPSVSRVYTGKAAAVGATVDPDVVLLLDVNRENNTIIRRAPTATLGVRLALNWMTWLQQAMLSYTAIV